MEAWYNIEDAIVKVKMASYDVFGPILNSSSTISTRKTLAPQNPIYAHNKTIARPRPITTGVWMTFLMRLRTWVRYRVIPKREMDSED
jgi:hypothetical protein